MIERNMGNMDKDIFGQKFINKTVHHIKMRMVNLGFDG